MKKRQSQIISNLGWGKKTGFKGAVTGRDTGNMHLLFLSPRHSWFLKHYENVHFFFTGYDSRMNKHIASRQVALSSNFQLSEKEKTL